MKKNAIFIGALAGGALLAGGYFFFSSSVSKENYTELSVSNMPAEQINPKSVSTQAIKETQSGKHISKERSVQPSTVMSEQEILNEAPIETSPYDRANATVDNLRLLLAEAESSEKQGEIQSILQSLLENAEQDASALSSIIDNYRLDPNSEMGTHLQSVLAEIKDPEVEAAAIDLVKSGGLENQIAGLDLLAQLNIPSESTYNLTRDILAANDNPEVLMSALNAMPVIPLPAQDAQEAMQQLSTLARSSADSGVRSASIFKIGQWAKDEHDLSPVVGILQKSNDPDDRISAIMAIQESNVVSDQLRYTLAQLMSNKKELWEVRRMAAESLTRFKMSSKEYAAYQTFLKEQGDIAEGN
ncbi:hypothetical protein KCM76_03540 [Zooshikella marina]|uniref:HEAT repeat domain-containing protein n=1 Tax=Zooshikella ganghwensis TaxID=202772 RepID=UPI001BB0CEEB|nr:HEAT repeat domain-containing protein [Zooshikella ganghwensis]MBU2705038.1 hypothetical protein [Zooshikella ganghwensis]